MAVCLRCPHRAEKSRAEGLPGVWLAEMQGSFYAEYPGACITQRERPVCREAESHLAAADKGGSHSGSPDADQRVWRSGSPGHCYPGRGPGGCPTVLGLPLLGPQEEQLYKHPRTSEPRDSEAVTGRGNLPQHGFLSETLLPRILLNMARTGRRGNVTLDSHSLRSNA